MLHAAGVRVSFADHDVLHGVDLTVAPGDKVGLVGPNGAGKSTLLRILAGQEDPDDGRITATGTVGLMPQEPARRENESVGGYLARRTGVRAADEALTEAQADIVAEPDRYDAALQRWMALGGDDLEERAAAVCGRLGLEAPLLGANTTTLSGGQMARVGLAAVLLSRFDTLLLDEPTNDLDMAGLEMLEEFVVGLRTGLVVVSHDREFLARTITSVLELDPVNRSSSTFQGGWDAYLHEREVARRQQRERFEEVQRKKTALVDQVQAAKERSVRGALRAKHRPKDGDRVQKGARIEAATAGAAKVRSLETRLGHLDRADAVEPRKEWELRLDLPDAPRSGDVVATLRGVTARLGDFTFGPVDVDLAAGDRVRIVGENGAGKSTLLRLLLGHLPPDSGTAQLGARVVIGELDQARAALRTEATVVELLRRAAGLEDAEARTLLAKFGLKGPRVVRPASVLSPGERTRAVLAVLMAGGTNLLVLDEPTNHLDMPAIEQLEQALDRYAGTLLLVSHDRRLLDAVTTARTWRLEAGQLIER